MNNLNNNKVSPLLPEIPNEWRYEYKHYFIHRDLYNENKCYLYLFQQEPVTMAASEYNANEYLILNKYGNRINYRRYEFEIGGWSDGWLEMFMDDAAFDVDRFTETLIYNNFTFSMAGTGYETNPLPNDGLAAVVEQEIPGIPNLHLVQYKHYYIVQDKENTHHYYLYLLKYEPASTAVDSAGYDVFLTKYGEQIYYKRYFYNYEYTGNHWSSGDYGYRLLDNEIADSLVYNNFIIGFHGLVYGTNPLPGDGLEPAPEPDFPAIPYEGEFQYKHYYIVQDKKELENYYLYLLAYEPAAIEVNEIGGKEYFMAFQKYGKEITGCYRYRYTIGETAWRLKTNTLKPQYKDIDGALVRNNFSMDFLGNSYRKHADPDDGVIPAPALEFPTIPEVSVTECEFRYYLICQDKEMLEQYFLYLFKEKPAACTAIGYSRFGFLNTEGDYIDIHRCLYTIGATAWDTDRGIYGSLPEESIDHFIEYCNFDIPALSYASGDISRVIGSPCNPYPNDGVGIGTVRNGWTTINGKCYYYEEGKQKRGNSGWLESDGTTYYLLGANNWARVENDSVTTVGPSRSRTLSVVQRQEGRVYAFNNEGKMYRGGVELHGDHYLFDEEEGSLIRMITGTDTYTVDTPFLAVRQSPLITDGNPLVTLPYLQRVTVPLPKKILTRPDLTVWIEINYSGTGVFAKKGWVELKDLKEYYPPEGYENYIVTRPDRVTDISGGKLGDLSVGTPVKVVVPKVLSPDPFAPGARSEDRIKIIYGGGFGWFVEMSLEKISAEGSNNLVSKQQLKDIMSATNHFQAGVVNDAMVDELNNMLQDYNITKIQEIQMFLAVITHETRLALTEAGWLSEAQVRQHCQRYEPGTSRGTLLGNTQTGDGYLFRGAGYIQLTGRDNYGYFSTHIKNKYGEDVDIMNNGADCIASKYAWTAAGYFWEKNKINQVIANGNTNGLTVEGIFKKVSNAVFQGNANASSDPDEWSDRKDRLDEVIKLYY